MRKIIHCDCDSFYASVEMRDDPSLRDLPVAVGGQPDKRGVVATCNYKAREFGVHSAMPMSTAVRLCPDLVIVSTNFSKYRHESQRIHAIFRDYTDLIEPLSLDEAYLDVSGSQHLKGSATLIAQEIRDRVRSEVGITISAGIAPNKFLAKIASDWDKPDGQFTITPDQVASFVADLPVNKIFGVGSVTAERMKKMGISTCADLQKMDLPDLSKRFGKFGARLHDLCRGIDNRPVSTNRERKSLSAERTYATDLADLEACREALVSLVEELTERIGRAECQRRIIGRTIKVRFSGFETTTAANIGVSAELDDYQSLLDVAWQRGQRPVRLIGVGVKLAPPKDDTQLGLF